LPNKTANISKHNWNQFLLVVKAAALKPQISKISPANSKHRRYILHLW